MNLSVMLKSLQGKTPSEVQAEMIKLYSSMPPNMVLEHMKNLQHMAQQYGEEKEREEIVCRLLANGMSVDEISVILCIRADAVRIIETNHVAKKIPDYARTLKERRKRRTKQQ